jgi:hypothetical protein
MMKNKEKTIRQLSVKQWSMVLQERKYHMVAAALKIVGQGGMQHLAEEASRIFSKRNSLSLGGGFIIAMKSQTIRVGGKEVSLYTEVKERSGEKDIQRERCNKRQIAKKQLVLSISPNARRIATD